MGDKGLDMSDFFPAVATQELDLYDGNDTDAIEGWHATPPPHLPGGEDANQALNPKLKTWVEGALDDSGDPPAQRPAKHHLVTPASSQPAPKHRRSRGKLERASSMTFDSPDPSGSRNPFGLKSMMSNMPRKQDRVLAQQELVNAQERITTQMTDTMCNILTSNHALEMETKRELARDELETKKELARDEMRHKNRQARTSMLVELIRAGTFRGRLGDSSRRVPRYLASFLLIKL